MGAATTAIRSFITPTTAAVAAVGALALGIGTLVARAASAEQSAKQFDVILKATGRSGGTTGKELEAAAENLRDVGLSASEAREQFKKFIGEGGIASQAALVTRVGKELNSVLGEGSMERFIAAAAKGGPALEDIAKKLGIATGESRELVNGLNAARSAADAFNRSINDALGNQGRALAGAARDKMRQLEDLQRQSERERRRTGDAEVDARRQRAAQEEDIEIAAARRIEDINRESAERLNELIRQRNQANAEALAQYNAQITAAAQTALDRTSLITQIAQKVLGSFQGQLSPMEEAFNNLGTAWSNLTNTLAKSETITALVRDFGELIRSIQEAIQFADRLAKAIGSIPGLPAVLGGRGGNDPTIRMGPFGPERMAAGGLIRGPGTGTSDSIGAFLSNGEFVVNALATRMNLPLLQAINSMRMPAMPRFSLPRGFAMGGLVAAGGGGTRAPINLHIGGETFGLEADDATAQRVIRFARRRALLSAGRKPSMA